MTDTIAEAVERLAAVFDRRGPKGGGSINGVVYGEIAATLRALVAERAALLAECERLRLGGCARGQITTQWCAEAVQMMAERDAALSAGRAMQGQRDAAIARAEAAEAALNAYAGRVEVRPALGEPAA